MRGHCEDRSSLGEVMRPWEPSPERNGTQGSELAVGVPPAGIVHLADASDYEAELEEAIEVYGHRELINLKPGCKAVDLG